MNFNQVTLVGRLVAKPETRYTPQGTAVLDITVVINDKVGQNEVVTFVDTTVWGVTAENVSKYLDKGSLVLVSGRLHQDKWVDKESGGNRSKLKVIANRVVFLEGKKQNESVSTEKENTEDDNSNNEDIPF